MKGPVENDALLRPGGRQQQQHKDRAGIQKDMRPQEFATQGFAPRQICGTLLLVWVTKEELSVSTRQTRDNKATKIRSIIIVSLQGKGWRSTKIRVGNFPRQLNFLLLYELQYQIVVQLGAQRKCLGEETLLSARGRRLSLSWPSHVHIQPNLLKSCH